MRGPEHLGGDRLEAERLAGILRIKAGQEDQVVQGVHGLHPYPGRMHPLWARRIVRSLADDASLIDPFCGGGTVLVEARRRGLHARGSDINPVAVRLARLKAIPHADPELVTREADRCIEGCGRRRKTPFSALAADDQAKTYPRHVLAGLISLRDEIEATKDDRVKELLLFCLSPLLDKLAARGEGPPPRVPRTAVRDQFANRVRGWLQAWKELDEHRWGEVERADARWLPWKPGTSSAAVSSPPYPGVYDYAGHQAWRLRWLGEREDLRDVVRAEIGRRHGRPDWSLDMSRALTQISRTLAPGSPVYLVVGDGVMQDKVLRAEKEIDRMTRDMPLEPIARASQERPHFHKGSRDAFARKPRLEHLLLLRRTRD